MHYHVIVFNDSSREDDMEKAYRSLALWFYPDKNQHSQVSGVMKMINEAKEWLEKILRHNDTIRDEESFRMDTTMEEERVSMAHNNIMIFSEYLSSDDWLETLSVELSGSGRW